MDETKPEKKNSGKILIILLIVVLLAVIAGLVVLLVLRPQKEAETPTYEREVMAKLGQLENKSDEEIQAELNRVIEEGMFHIAINNNPVFQDGESSGNLKIENVPNNNYLMRVEIYLEDTNELVYSTKYIEPNNHIQSAPLNVVLPAGEYFATAIFYAYDPDSLVEMGTVSALMTLHILN